MKKTHRETHESEGFLVEKYTKSFKNDVFARRRRKFFGVFLSHLAINPPLFRNIWKQGGVVARITTDGPASEEPRA